MSVYKEKNYLGQNDDSAFDKDYSPGAEAPLACIYRCMGCHREIGFAGASPCRRRTTTRILYCRETFVGD